MRNYLLAMNICVLAELCWIIIHENVNVCYVPLILLEADHIYILIPTTTLQVGIIIYFINKEIKTQIYFLKSILPLSGRVSI